mmetsp:Transcript_10432/g.22221  ORF Transcript_10432/g.22221 Transcript_10432/m.22221 type:complete len:237 (-) Transcript_10432:16-726(-)
MRVLAVSFGEIGHSVRQVGHKPSARGEKAFDADRPAGVNPTGGDADLGAEPKAEPIRKARRAVVEHIGGVDATHECLRHLKVLRDDDVGVAGAILVDVCDGGVHIGDELHRQGERAVLMAQRCRRGQTECSGSLWPPEQGDASVGEGGEQSLRGARGDEAFVEQQRLQRVACGGVVRLRVDGDLLRLAEIRRPVDEDVADPIGVAESRDARAVHDRLHHLVGASRNAQVDLLVELE